ncbi:MAG: allophanate hydrolase [Gammaproteobacteria bacterium]|nr:allophanate hydrolase [Gammaproteobacteria bacterium]
MNAKRGEMDLSITGLAEAYGTSAVAPREVLAYVGEAIRRGEDRGAWIHLLDEAALAPCLERLGTLDPAVHPLWGVPFAIKDNIDLAGCPTTAACPAYSYVPEASATVVDQLLSAGAVPLGKTNLDQFATGLVGTRSPYGAMRNAIDPDYIAGGSSGGSAVAVKLGMCSFALGTDTAGSGRVPAAFNGLVGFKPSFGWWSARGVVPACRTLDCVSVFTRSVADARVVAGVAGGFDPDDAYSRRIDFAGFDVTRPRAGVIDPDRLSACDADHASAYRAFLASVSDAQVEIDPAPLFKAGRLLYEGPWLSERFAVLEDFMARHSDDMHPVTRDIISDGAVPTAASAFQAQYELAGLKREASRMFEAVDVLILPTAPTIYTIGEVERDPVGTNSRLGIFANFANLLDLCALAIPAGSLPNGLSFGVTLIAPAGRDHALLDYGARLLGESVAAGGRPGETHIAVCGAHLSGQPLNGELARLGGYLVRSGRTKDQYRLYALPDGKRPALIRDASGGAAIEVEVWSLPTSAVGAFLAGVAPPLGLGRIELADGAWVAGFIAEPRAVTGAAEITRFGGWRAYRASDSH